MVEYACNIFEMGSLPVGLNGLSMPLCNSCKNPNCTNLIIEKEVHAFGYPLTMRLFKRPFGFYMVTECEGYISQDSKMVDDEYYENLEGEDSADI
jgi:hypothetical protein